MRELNSDELSLISGGRGGGSGNPGKSTSKSSSRSPTGGVFGSDGKGLNGRPSTGSNGKDRCAPGGAPTS
jgi:hypothetical protein